MERLSDLLEQGLIALDVQAPDFDACLGTIANALAERRALDAAQCTLLTEALRDRERLAATAIGHGVAVPHAYVAGIPRVMLLFARLAEALPYTAPDSEPVDLVFMLIGPPEAQAGHLPLLARLVRLLHDRQLPADLRKAASPDDVQRAVRDMEQRHA